MTTGRINQVRTIGGPRARRASPARVRAPMRARAPPRPSLTPGPLALRRRARGLSPDPAASDARARLPTPRRSAPRAGLGRAGGRAAHAGWPPRALARQPPACAVLAWPDRVPASFWFTCSERRGAPLGTVRLRTATRMKACDPSATASALPLGRPPPRKDTSRLRGGHRSPHDGPVSTRRRTGARIRTPHGRPPARAWLRRRAELAPWPPPEALPPYALRADPTRLPHTIWACEGLRKRRPSSPPVFGRGGETSSPPENGRGGASGAQAGGPRPRPGSRLGAAHLRTGGEEECTGTADTNPGCNYLVRGYSPSMHYFWRGDMPHFSSPLPFQRGACGCRAAAVPRPPRMACRLPRPARAGQSRPRAAAVPRLPRPARSCMPSISAGMAHLAGAGQRTTLQTGGQPGAACTAQVRRGVTAAISNWPAASAAGQPQQARPPVAGGLAPFSHYF